MIKGLILMTSIQVKLTLEVVWVEWVVWTHPIYSRCLWVLVEWVAWEEWAVVEDTGNLVDSHQALEVEVVVKTFNSTSSETWIKKALFNKHAQPDKYMNKLL